MIGQFSYRRTIGGLPSTTKAFEVMWHIFLIFRKALPWIRAWLSVHGAILPWLASRRCLISTKQQVASYGHLPATCRVRGMQILMFGINYAGGSKIDRFCIEWSRASNRKRSITSEQHMTRAEILYDTENRDTNMNFSTLPLIPLLLRR
jgi:hypothetical protein